MKRKLSHITRMIILAIKCAWNAFTLPDNFYVDRQINSWPREK